MLKYYLFCIVLLSIASACYSLQCKQFPVANVASKVCEGSECTATILSTFYSPITPLYESCLKLDDINGLTLGVKINMFEYTSKASYCYMTDSPVLTASKYCGCYSFTDESCPCPNPLGDGYTAKTCLSTSAATTTCPLSSFGNICSNIGVSGNERFKICAHERIKDTIGSVVVTYANRTFVGSISRDGSSYIALPDGIEVNMLATPSLTVPSPLFSVLDVVNPQNFYLADNTNVNGLNEFDYGKLGWLKVGAQNAIGNNIKSTMSVHIEDCSSNKYSVQSDVLLADEFLNSNQHLLANNREPNSHIIDSKFPDRLIGGIAVPSHLYGREYVIMGNGLIIVNMQNIPVGIGFDKDGFVPIQNWEKIDTSVIGVQTTKLTTCGTQLVTSWSTYQTVLGFYGDVTKYIVMRVDSSRRCAVYDSYVFRPSDNSFTHDKTMAEGFTVRLFPSTSTSTIMYSAEKFVSIDIGVADGTPTRDLHLLPHAGLALFTITGDFKFRLNNGNPCTITFKSCNESHCIVDVKNGPCTCLISDNKNVLASHYKLFGAGVQYITLTSSKNFTGYIELNVECGDKDYTTMLHMNRTINPYTGNTTAKSNDTQVANSLFDKISDWVDSWIGDGQDTFLSYIIDIIIFVAIFIIGAIILGAVIYLIIMLFPTIFSCCLSKFIFKKSDKAYPILSDDPAVTPQELSGMMKLRQIDAYRYKNDTELLSLLRSGKFSKIFN